MVHEVADRLEDRARRREEIRGDPAATRRDLGDDDGEHRGDRAEQQALRAIEAAIVSRSLVRDDSLPARSMHQRSSLDARNDAEFGR